MADEVSFLKPPFFLLFFCSPLFGNCPFFFLLSSPGFRFFLYFYLFRRLFFLSAGFFLLPLQITDIFLCLFFDAPLGGGIKLPVFFFYFLAGLVRPVQTAGEPMPLLWKALPFFLLSGVSLSLAL